MTDRLFDIDEIPEVPLFREPAPGRGALIMDDRVGHDYPPDWHSCQTCGGSGDLIHPESYTVERGRASISRSPGQGGNWARVTHDETGLSAFSDAFESGIANLNAAITKIRPQVRALGYHCPDCLGMGSRKAMVRLLADHRCERCHHPYMPRGDANVLGLPPSGVGGEHMGGRWSSCDPHCVHLGPIRWRDAAERDAADLDAWRYQDLDVVGQSAGDGILDYGPSGEPIWRYDVEAEWRILTVHHLDGDKANLAWWNLAALCQRCHLEIQARVVLERVYPHEHSDWFKPHAAGWYARAYLGLDLTRDETLARLDELLALEATPA